MNACWSGWSLAVASQSLDREHLPSLALGGEEDAGVHRPAIEEDRADATFCLKAVLLGSRQAEVGPEHVEERAVRLGQDLVALTVDGEGERHLCHDAVPRMRSRQRVSARVTSVSTMVTVARRGTDITDRLTLARGECLPHLAARPAWGRGLQGTRSAACARRVVGATAPRAIRASAQRSPVASSVSRAATQTTEISIALRRPALRKAVAERSGRSGETGDR